MKENAYAGTVSGALNYLDANAQRQPYQAGDPVALGNSYQNRTQSQLSTYGTQRRVATVPVVDCSSWAASTPQTVPVLGYACVLMLHPIANDTAEVWLEYLGKSSDEHSPCATQGAVGGPGSTGPKVPALVQ